MGNMRLQVHGMGLDLRGRRLFPAEDGKSFTTHLIEALDTNGPRAQQQRHVDDASLVFRGEQQAEVIDVGNVASAGWTFLVNRDDPRREQIVAALAPLAEQRKMSDPAKPLLYVTCDPIDWGTWLADSYFALRLQAKRAPRYVLIVGGPDQVPFGLQSLLDTVANVGRIDLPTVDQLACYVAKLLRLELAADPVVSREAVVFAPDGGPNDPTHFSRQYMAEPIADLMANDFKLSTTKILGDQATKGALVISTERQETRAGLHGVSRTWSRQRAIRRSDPLQRLDMLPVPGRAHARRPVRRGDVPPDDKPFLEGAVFFQFACYGYGTPAVSEYAHWLDQPGKETRNADHDFVAALPKRLLAHPKGPIAFIGHLDTAFLHGFADAGAPEILTRWHNRIEPFVSAVRMLLGYRPLGSQCSQ